MAKLHVASNIPENSLEKGTEHSADGATGNEKTRGGEKDKMEVLNDEAGGKIKSKTGEGMEGKTDNKMEGKIVEVKIEDKV